MKNDRLQPNDGSMAKSPKECGGVVMERKKSMMKRSITNLMRVALVAVFALVFGLSGLATSAEAAVVVDTTLANVINVVAVTGNGTVNAGNGANRLMVLGCTTEYGTAEPGTYTINADYGGQTFTTIASDGSQRQTAWIGYIDETKIAAAGNTTLTATISQATNARDLICGVVVYEGVDQGTPIAGSNAQASAGAASLTFTTIPSTADGYAVYIAGHNGGTATVSAGFTEAFDVASTQSNGSGGDGATTGSTVTGTVTFSASSRCALAMATVNPFIITDTTAPSVGTVTITTPAANTATYVPANVTFTAAITEPDSTPTCQYTTNGSTWSGGVISGASSPYTCTATVTGLTGAVTLNIRASSIGGGPTAGTALSRTVDTTAPVTSAAPAAGTYGSDQSVTLTPVDAGVGVASTVYCVDTTNVCVPGTSYVGAVDVTGTPGSSVTKYLRYAATDLFGAVETTKSAQYIIDQTNAAPTLSIIEPNGVGDVVTVGALYNITYSLADSDNIVTAAFYYDTNADMVGGTAITGACAAAAEGAGVTCAWNTTGVPTGVSYYVYGVTNDGANPAVSALSPGVITVNPIINSTAAGTATATPGNTAINVSAPYTNDSNGNNTLLIEWGLNGVDYTMGSMALPHAASPYTYSIPSLTNGTAYQVRVTYQDGDTVTGTAVQTITNVTPDSWTDNQMLHNSLRFACSVLAADGSTISDQTTCENPPNNGTWNEDRRHTGGWGTSSSTDYGAILCSTCHAKNSGNIKRVAKQVGLAGVPGAAEANITYTSAAPGTADLGSTSSDALDHTTSNRICEVCHTYSATDPGVATPTGGVRFHGYNMSSSPESHAVDADCIDCHAHKVGFRASCAACHGNPPETGKLVTKASSGALTTGSTTAGAHLAHVNDQAIGCATCHDGSVGQGATHNTDGTVTLTFTSLPGGAVGGSYDGQTTVTYDTTDGANTTLTKLGSKTCANYCHGSTINGTNPVWDGAAVCGSCHGNDAASASTIPSGISHNTHVNAMACSACHGANGTGPSGHLDGVVNWDVTALPSGTTATYSGSTTGTSSGLAPSGTYGSCANVTCHGTGTPQWNNAASVACGSCHGTVGTYSDARDGAPTAGQTSEGKHAAHLALSNTLTGSYCSLCHDGAGSGSVTGKHANGTPDFNFNAAAGVGALYTPGATPSCSSLDAANCHAGTANWDPAATMACTDCHTGSGAGAKAVGSTSSHTLVTTGGTFGDCTDCHGGHYGTAGGVDIPNNVTVGINYGHGGIKLGGTGTVDNINGDATADLSTLTVEAQMCWTCHDAQTVKVSEWGANTQAATGNSPYNYGTLTTSNWTTATWSSTRSPIFDFKSGAIQSTHTANSNKTYPGTGDTLTANAGGGFTETRNDVRDIRCSYCHDVHELSMTPGDTKADKPYLRGSWMGNPYEEDGPPRTQNGTTSYSVGLGTANRWGNVPRADLSNRKLGGFFIDQNNAVPMSATATANGTAATYPTAGWGADDTARLNASAGLCILCHGDNINAMNQNTTENGGASLWVGTNGHSNAVIGGTSTAKVNLYDTRGGSTGNNPYAHYSGWSTDPNRSGQGFRTGNATYAVVSGSGSALPKVGISEGTTVSSTRPYKYKTLTGGYELTPATPIVQVAGQTTAQNKYHNFSCSKCHNPHASRLPKLMITNCLDTKHNTWDNQFGRINTTNNVNVTLSNFTSAQNCHRLTGDDPDNAGDARGHNGTGYSGAGWNKVTPW